MGRSDLVGAAIVVSWLSVLAAVVLSERGGEAPHHEHRPAEVLAPRADVPLPEDHASYDVRRGTEVVGRVIADQGPLKEAPGLPAGAVWYVRRALELEVAKLGLPPAAGELPAAPTVSTTLEATLASDLAPVTFGLSTAGPGGALLSARGSLAGTVARIELRLGERREELVVPLAARPLLEEAAMPLLAAAGDLRAGARFELATFDPETGKPDTIVLEVVGPEVVALALGKVLSTTKVLRDATGPAPRAIWVDGAGRVIREELPLGLLAVRADPPEEP